MANQPNQPGQPKPADDPAVRVITEKQILETADKIKVRPYRPTYREHTAYKLLLLFLMIGFVLAFTTIVVFGALAYHDPKNAETHLDLCLRLFTGVTTPMGGPAIVTLILGYLFGRQNKDDPPEERD